MASILIGRKELFSFAERHSSHRFTEYASLGDGEVLCHLFSLVFPELRISPTPAQTHSTTQRAHLNWEQLYRRFARLHIPLHFLRPSALQAGDAEWGFTTLVLFYFLYHLSKRADFSSEFAQDVAAEVTRYLQSTDCIVSLLLGHALSWSAVPADLAVAMQKHPAFHRSEEELRALEDEAAQEYRAVSGRPRATSRTRRLPWRPRRLAASSHIREASQALEEGEEEEEKAHRGSSGTSSASATDSESSPPPHPWPSRGRSRTSSASSETLASSEGSGSSSTDGRQQRRWGALKSYNDAAVDAHVPALLHSRSSDSLATFASASCEDGDAAVAAREPHHVKTSTGRHSSTVSATGGGAVPPSSVSVHDTHMEAALQAKEAECEALQMRVAQLLSLLADTRSAAAILSGQRNGTADAGDAATVKEQGADGGKADAAVERRQPAHVDPLASTEARRCLHGSSCSGQREHGSLPSPPLATAAVGIDRATLEAEVAALTADMVDESGAVVDVPERANLLHCLLLEHLQSTPRLCAQMQQWLWSLVAAHHTMEGRLFAATDLLRSWAATLTDASTSEQKTLPSASAIDRSTTADLPTTDAAPHRSDSASPGDEEHRGTTALMSRVEYADLEALHDREHQLRQALRTAQAQNAATVQRAMRRERLWKALCSAVYAAEQASYGITACDTAAEVEERLKQREEHYRTVEDLTEKLVENRQQGADEVTAAAAPPQIVAGSPMGGDRVGVADTMESPCAALQLLVERLKKEREGLVADVSRLADALAALQGHHIQSTTWATVERAGVARDGESSLRASRPPPFATSAVTGGPHGPRGLAALLRDDKTLQRSGPRER